MTRIVGRGKPARALGAVRVLAALLCTLPAACGIKERPMLSEAELEERRTAMIEADLERIDKSMSDVVDRLGHEYDEYEAGRRPAPPRLELLAISGGGDYGAFATGFLIGWGEVTDPEMKRPDFDAVTGVSTGALIAPFAYVGTDEAYARVEEFYRNPKKDWATTRGLLFFLPNYPSFMQIPGLERDIRAAVDAPFVAQIAEQRRKGKLLSISATNLDLSEQRAWEVGEEAIKAQETGETKKIADILLASSAIPFVFPPVEIDGFLYADGGVTGNVLLRLDPSVPHSFMNTWRERYPNRPFPKTRYWVIFNNWMRAPAKLVQPRWPEVGSPSMTASVRSATLAEFRWITAQVNYVNTVLGSDIELRVVAIPADFRPPVEGTFKKETMNMLADLGRKAGADPKSWQLMAAPDHKPLELGK